MNGKSFVTGTCIGILLVAAAFVVMRQFDLGLFRSDASNQAETSPTPTVSVSPMASGSAGVSVRTFAVTGEPFSFNLKEIKVNKGDTVKIVFTNTEGMHDWVIDEFSARTPRIQAGQTIEVTFVADKAGSFQYYCSVGNHRAQGMWGTLIVQ